MNEKLQELVKRWEEDLKKLARPRTQETDFDEGRRIGSRSTLERVIVEAKVLVE